uniref:Cytochrome P450 4c3 n=1 Tax=Heterorhabditis bacteriophora TaxID=37862 RepID=A0A1I7XJ88_HETBA
MILLEVLVTFVNIVPLVRLRSPLSELHIYITRFPVVRQGEKNVAIAKKLCVTRMAVQRTVERYQELGIVKYCSRSRRPRSHCPPSVMVWAGITASDFWGKDIWPSNLPDMNPINFAIQDFIGMAVLTYVIGAVIFGFLFYWKHVFALIKERRRIIKFVDLLPGPLSVPILGTTWQFKWNMRDLTIQFQEWGKYYAEKGYGLIRIWISFKPIVVCLRPETAKIILESNETITKGSEYDILLPWLGTGLLISTGEKWRSRRKMLTPSFHFNVLNNFLITHDYQSKIFVDQLEKYANSGEQFDIFPYIKRCALDIICETAMGCSVSAQENHNHPYVISVQRLSELAFMYQRMPWMWIKAIWYGSSVGFNYDRHLKTVTDFTRQVIKSPIYVVKTISSRFLQLALCNLNFMNFTLKIILGHDTTAASLGWTLWCLAHNNTCQKKIQEEMDIIFGSSNRSCTNDDLKQMKYLDKCIKESLRLRPSVPNFTRKVDVDIVIEGITVPKGCSILISPHMIHTNPVIYNDPLTFDPERFNEENVQKRHPFSYIPFSAGPRNCIGFYHYVFFYSNFIFRRYVIPYTRNLGQKFALMEEKTLLSWFFRYYNICSDIQYPDNIPLPEIILRPSLGFPVRISRRDVD